MSTTNGAVAPPDDGVRLFFNHAYERATIGGTMECSEQDNEVRIAEVLEFIQRQDFHRDTHRHMWDAILDLRSRGLHCGRDAVVNWLDGASKFDDAFKPFDVDQILKEAPRPCIPLEPAKKVKELSQLRGMMSATQRITRVLETANDPAVTYQRIEAMLDQVRPPSYIAGGEMTLADLMAEQFPPRVSAVQHFFEEGKSYLIVGGPKAGKSIFVLQCAIAMAAGTLALGSLATGAPRDVLYACLDDGKRRTQLRSRALLSGTGVAIPPRMTLKFTFEPEENKVRYFRTWTENHPNGFVFIDLLENIREKRTRDVYADDYQALRWTSDLAHGPSNCGIATIHHARKTKSEGEDGSPLETASGSNGLMGAVDAGIVFHPRKLQDPINRVSVTGRDEAQESYDLEWSDVWEGWEFFGAAQAAGGKPKPLGRQRAQAMAAVNVPRKLKDWATEAQMDYVALRKLARKMLRDGQVRQYTDGAYIRASEAGRAEYPYPLTEGIPNLDDEDEGVDG